MGSFLSPAAPFSAFQREDYDGGACPMCKNALGIQEHVLWGCPQYTFRYRPLPCNPLQRRFGWFPSGYPHNLEVSLHHAQTIQKTWGVRHADEFDSNFPTWHFCLPFLKSIQTMVSLPLDSARLLRKVSLRYPQVSIHAVLRFPLLASLQLTAIFGLQLASTFARWSGPRPQNAVRNADCRMLGGGAEAVHREGRRCAQWRALAMGQQGLSAFPARVLVEGWTCCNWLLSPENARWGVGGKLGPFGVRMGVPGQGCWRVSPRDC